MSSYTIYTVLVILTSIMMIAVNSTNSEGLSQAELYENGYPKTDYIGLEKRPSFYVGSRYGRSPLPSPRLYATKSRRLNIVPKADRFFLGSRYGKRSSHKFTIPLTAFYDQQQQQQQQDNSDLPSSSFTFSSNVADDTNQSAGKSIIQSNQSNNVDNNSNSNSNNNNYYKMSCIYTGYKNYFKCSTATDIYDFSQQFSDGDLNSI